MPTCRMTALSTVLSIPLTEASAKVRTGPPVDDEEDYELPVWAGVIPLQIVANACIADPRLARDMPTPKYAIDYNRTPQSAQKP